MTSIQVGGITTAFLGILWALLAVLNLGTDDAMHDVMIGAGVAIAGMATAIAATWWENR